MASSEGSASRGAKIFKTKCAFCHTTNDGGPHKMGPNLHGVINRVAGSVEGFAYSDAFKSNKSVVWTESTLYEYLLAPKEYIKGTKKKYKGLKSPQDSKDVVAYLVANNNSSSTK